MTWTSPTKRKWMKRLDHSMIFVFIAGSYTPFALLALPSEQGMVLFWIVWAGAIAGVLLKMFWPSAPAWVGVPLYLLLGWVAALFIVPIMHGAGVAALVLLIVGGALYSIGGVLYGLKWPNPWPTTFGHHEFFHACTAVAAICHYIAMWFAVFYSDFGVFRAALRAESLELGDVVRTPVGLHRRDLRRRRRTS